MVNRWNKAIAVGLRHNHDISFIATQCRTMAIVYYVTNYATKVEDPVWKRAAAAAELFGVLGNGIPAGEKERDDDVRQPSVDSVRGNRTRQFLMRVANRVFTDRALSQVEVVAHLLGYGTEFANNEAWAFLNVSSLYWHIFRRWRHLRRAAGMDGLDEPVDETVLLEEAGQRISLVQAYPHRGEILRDLSLYEYMSVVQLRRKDKNGAVARGGVRLDSAWPLSRTWAQSLRRPGKHAVVCLDGYLSMDFGEEDEVYYRRAAVQHLAMFAPWESFLSETSGDINEIWQARKQVLSRRMSNYVDNIQLLRRSAEDARRDARQWAAISGEADPAAVDTVEPGLGEEEDSGQAVYRSGDIGSATRLIDVLRKMLAGKQVTASSSEISEMVRQLYRFQQAALGSLDELRATAVVETAPRTGLPGQEQLKSIKSQQRSVSRERERMIQGIQSRADHHTTGHAAAVYSVLNGFGEQDVQVTEADSERLAGAAGPSTRIQFGAATSFAEAGRRLAESLTLNGRQSIAVQLVCRQLDRIRLDERGTSQLCLFIGGEGGTGKSRVIEAVAALFASKGIGHRLFAGSADAQKRQFRPVQERSILLPSEAIPWDDDKSFRTEQRRQHDRAHALWNRFTTVVVLTEQVRAAGDPTLRRLLTRVRQGVQDRSDVDLLNSRCYREARRIPWESGITVVTPLNRNRWNLNVEAVLSFQRQRQAPLRIFLSEHKWKGGRPTEEEALMMLSHGDDSAIPVPAVLMFVPGMPIVVNQNTHQGLKLVNGAGYTGLEVIIDRAYPGHRVDGDVILHFGPPAGILLASETTSGFHFAGMPPGTILLTPVSTKIECQRKRPWQQNDVVRRGLPCAAAFACTDYKVQGRTLSRVALELRGTRTTVVNSEAVPSQCDPYSLYVQLSRCPSPDGIMLLSRARERDIVGNTVPEVMTAAEKRLEQLSEATIREAETWDR
ncbi:hypothetical protein RB600_005247 [Gaeumannomyces tritici]